MDSVYMTQINIHNVRHLKDITIKLSPAEKKHLILTGINGSGKTSVLSSLAEMFDYAIQFKEQSLERLEANSLVWRNKPLTVSFSLSREDQPLGTVIQEKSFSYVYLPAIRSFKPEIAKSIESIEAIAPEERYVSEKYSTRFLKYLVLMNYRRLSAKDEGDESQYERIVAWFENFTNALKEIYNCPQLKLRTRIHREEEMI